MSDLPDLFAGFASHWIDAPAGRIFARSHGAGAPLLLLHGFPQTHAMWARIAPRLAERFRVIVMDLRGYGWSSAPRSVQGAHYSKRAMGEDVLSVMDHFGCAHFSLVGHDRGARVAYRLALDHPGRVDKIAVLDIVPTFEVWSRLDAAKAMQTYHWMFLGQPEPMPETLIGKAPIEYLEHTLASWTADRTLSAFDPRALAHYRASFNDPSRIHAVCEDYRAGATIDHEHDAGDRAVRRTIGAPLLALWGDAGIPAVGASPLEVWRGWAADTRGQAVGAGHFIVEENPEATLAALQAFL